MMEAALTLAARGKTVFPVQPRGKIPLTSHGCKDASTDPAIVRSWWTTWPTANIGLATGPASGVFVLDIDGLEGEASLKALEMEHGHLPPTVEAITGGGGRHLFFRWPAGMEISNSAGRLGLGLDVRGRGGYVVAPPSIHPSGKGYAWSVDAVQEPADAPRWLLDLIIRPPDEATQRTPPAEWLELMKGANEGSRNETITRIAGKLIRCYLDPPLVLELCLAWNDARCKPPLPADEVVKVVYSIAACELRRRGD
jgi:hypothetical protein